MNPIRIIVSQALHPTSTGPCTEPAELDLTLVLCEFVSDDFSIRRRNRVLPSTIERLFERGDDELRGFVLDGDGAGELRPSRGKFGESRWSTSPRVELDERCRDTPVLLPGEPHDFCAEVCE